MRLDLLANFLEAMDPQVKHPLSALSATGFYNFFTWQGFSEGIMPTEKNRSNQKGWGLSKREYEQQLADEEAQQLRNFQAAVLTHTVTAYEPKEFVAPKPEGWKPADKKKTQPRPWSSLIKFKPQAKKLKKDTNESIKLVESSNKLHGVEKKPAEDGLENQETMANSAASGLAGLVSYSDESEDEAD
eukprot:Gb_08801 [translate_table: standard]